MARTFAKKAHVRYKRYRQKRYHENRKLQYSAILLTITQGNILQCYCCSNNKLLFSFEALLHYFNDVSVHDSSV